MRDPYREHLVDPHQGMNSNANVQLNTPCRPAFPDLTSKTILLTYAVQNNRKRAGRSVVDRSLGMGEAAGSIPAQSIRFSPELLKGSGLFPLEIPRAPRSSAYFFPRVFILGYQRDYSERLCVYVT